MTAQVLEHSHASAVALPESSTAQPTRNLRGLWRSRPEFVIFAVLQILDFLTTMVVMSRGGEEGNPAIKALMPYTGGVMAVLLCKILLVTATWRLSRRAWTLRIGNVLYGAVVVWNTAMIALTFI